MDLSKSFNPVPKPVKQRKEKPTPKFKEKRHYQKKKKQKKPMLAQGFKIPSRKERGEITIKEKQQIVEIYGAQCAECGYYLVEFHHIKFRSKMGRKGYRNLVPLCREHHTKCHRDAEYAQKWRAKHEAKYGPYYYMDKYDLWKLGLIPNTTDESFEEFMQKEEADRVQMGNSKVISDNR